MDFVALGFYAVVCGLLGLAGPRLGPPTVRFGIGAVVGLIAVTVLPLLRAALG
ncbi:hypothetical protein [Aestuariicoccus sp. MJ-SS9]|uniref:hypothetical protein n=1 Tax=Aestuariicoccus sp. MJ-SS9 TaxID=3079855 RepID=UPI00290F8EED|nr:hypothetical protein [Aestuariicoccus sp. MJ-SS9]MDU8911372.1 hypothetical protein [Aestuariicoccus sp. MJ-SS9]